VDFRAGEGLYVPPESFLGRRVEEVLPPPTGPRFLEAMAQVRRSGERMLVDYSLPFPEGERHFEARLRPLPGGRIAALCTDVTGRRQAEEEARRQKAQLQHLLSTSPSVIYSLRVGPEGAELATVSDNLARVLGWAAADFTDPRAWVEKVHPDDRAGAMAGGPRVLAEGHVVHGYRFRHRDGSWRWIRDELRLVRDEAGRPAEVVGAFSDVTAQREAEERLRESEERFRRAFADAPVGMALVGIDERFLQVNEALCRILGYPAEQLLQITVPQVTHPDDVAREEAQKIRLLRGDGSAFQMEKRYLHADGHVVWGALSVSAVNGPDGKPLYYIGQLEDVTERRVAEQALRESEERFRELVENASDLLAVFDGEGKVAFSTDSAAQALGYPLDEIRGLPAHDLVVPEDAERAMRFLAELGPTPGGSGRLELRMRRRDGSVRIFDSVVRNLLHVPAIRGFVVNSRDVTEQRQLEERFLQAQKLESVGRLAGGVAHDFNNLLVAILGYAEFLEEGIRAGNPSLEDLAEIRDAGERARDLTRQLLAVARRQVVDPRVMDLNEVLRDAEKLLRRVLGEDVDLAVVPATDLWRVKADPAQIQQVVLNLAVNARDAMPQGGKLTLETANVELDERYAVEHPGVVPGPYALLAVSDSGVGMSPAAQAHLFEPFFTTKPAGEGTGLGLATVYGIVQQAGGHIWVYSEPGQGTTFKIHLPRSEETPARPEPRGALRDHRGSETVLVVEDAAAVRELASRALAAAGYQVLLARSGAEALEIAARNAGPVHLLVTDVVMPEMSGRQLADALKRVRPDARVLYVSGYAENTIMHHGVLDAGVRFLPKPFTPAGLQQKVREVLDGPP